MIHAADGIIRTKNGEIVLIKRGHKPFKNHWALPGGMVEINEHIEDGLIREMKEEIGIIVQPLEILGVFSAPDRDPRGRVISTVFICNCSEDGMIAGDDAKELKILPLVDALALELAFDHKFILQCYSGWIKNKTTFWSNKFYENKL